MPSIYSTKPCWLKASILPLFWIFIYQKHKQDTKQHIISNQKKKTWPPQATTIKSKKIELFAKFCYNKKIQSLSSSSSSHCDYRCNKKEWKNDGNIIVLFTELCYIIKKTDDDALKL
jgi:hypothetical protein